MEKKKRASDVSVIKATGKNWQEWFALLDSYGAKDMDHKQIARMLMDDKHLTSGWWAQNITVEYEYAHGKRVLGETKDAGFQIGVQKTLDFSARKIWEVLTSPLGLSLWLGDLDRLRLEPGETYVTKDGTTGEVRTVLKGTRLRITWKPNEWKKPSTIQITLSARHHNTSIRFHQEHLAGEHERKQMQERWQQALVELEKVLAEYR